MLTLVIAITLTLYFLLFASLTALTIAYNVHTHASQYNKRLNSL